MAPLLAAFGQDEPPRGHTRQPVFPSHIQPFGKKRVPAPTLGQRLIRANHALMETRTCCRRTNPRTQRQRCRFQRGHGSSRIGRAAMTSGGLFPTRRPAPRQRRPVEHLTDPLPCEIDESDMMLTINWNHRPLLNRRHQPAAAARPSGCRTRVMPLSTCETGQTDPVCVTILRSDRSTGCRGQRQSTLPRGSA